MYDVFVKRLRAFVRAAWWTLLLWLVLLTGFWLIWLAMLHNRPEWVRLLWGGAGMDWPQMHRIVTWSFGASKLAMLIFAMLTVCLTLWLRRLRRM